MALVRRFRYILTNYISRQSTYGGVAWESSWTSANVLQDVPDAVCWRCKRADRRGDHLVHIAMNSDDVLDPQTIYHYRCIPSARWHVGKLAGSLPAWELPSDESPVEKAGTSSAEVPTT